MVLLLREQAIARGTSSLLWPWGCDLEFHNASIMFASMDKIVEFINKHSKDYGGIRVRYSTPREFFEKLYNESVMTSSASNEGTDLIDTKWPLRGPELSLLPLATVKEYGGTWEPGVEMQHWRCVCCSIATSCRVTGPVHGDNNNLQCSVRAVRGVE